MSVKRVLFSTFDVTRQVFHQTSLSYGIVNLKPLVPGHVLVIPNRVVPRLTDLHQEEITDLFLNVQSIGRVIEKAYKAQALTISIQDGKEAGQSVPHIHIHILPRGSTGPYSEDKDTMYPALEESENGLKGVLEQLVGENKGKSELQVAKDEDRIPRTIEDMEKEADWLKTFF